MLHFSMEMLFYLLVLILAIECLTSLLTFGQDIGNAAIPAASNKLSVKTCLKKIKQLCYFLVKDWKFVFSVLLLSARCVVPSSHIMVHQPAHSAINSDLPI